MLHRIADKRAQRESTRKTHTSKRQYSGHQSCRRESQRITLNTRTVHRYIHTFLTNVLATDKAKEPSFTSNSSFRYGCASLVRSYLHRWHNAVAAIPSTKDRGGDKARQRRQKKAGKLTSLQQSMAVC